LPPADLGVAAQAMLAGVLMLLSFSLGGWLQLLGVTPNVLFRDESLQYRDADGKPNPLEAFDSIQSSLVGYRYVEFVVDCMASR